MNKRLKCSVKGRKFWLLKINYKLDKSKLYTLTNDLIVNSMLSQVWNRIKTVDFCMMDIQIEYFIRYEMYVILDLDIVIHCHISILG